MTISLPIFGRDKPPADCSNCGACCETQSSPPAHWLYWLVDGFPEPGDDDRDEDAEIWERMPPEVRQTIIDYSDAIARDVNNARTDDDPCLWLDEKTKRCRHYEHRPAVCRSSLVVPGNCSCLTWRAERLPLRADQRERESQ